jgi:FkbM family methyltransferase
MLTVMKKRFRADIGFLKKNFEKMFLIFQFYLNSQVLVKIMRKILKKFGVSLIDYGLYSLLSKNHRIIQLAKILDSDAPIDLKRFILRNFLESKSQLFQDLVAHYINGFQNNGFFVEIGASDGVVNSNTYLLEKSFKYNGILVEPARINRSKIISNRECTIDFSAITQYAQEKVDFFESINSDLSTLNKYRNLDHHSSARKTGKRYPVSAVSLIDLLSKYEAPRIISYLSIDTEGSELDIIQNFDFSKYQFNFVTIEHNYNENRASILRVMSENGYKRIYADFSEWDDFFIHNSLLID